MSMLYPIGIQNFEEIRKGGYAYVDKTELIYKLVKSGKYYFLSRPRRFGKSLLISTLESYFCGRKDLFEGLAMEKLEKDWAEYPVFHLDLNTRKYEDKYSLEGILNQYLEKWEQKYGDEKKNRAPEERFTYVIERAAEKTGRNVVVLIDEYDKPMLQAIGNDALMTEYRNTLKAFYGVLKSCDRYLRFALLTGVTKFSKVSVFSDLNNLDDISLLQDYNNLCGITECELHDGFRDGILALAEKNGISYDEACIRLKEWYDGYHFASEGDDIYNPFSILNAMKSREFGSYWFETGTPTFLVELLKTARYNLNQLTVEVASSDSLGGIDSMYTNPVPILYQSGYLTIKGYDSEFRVYKLGFPNREVEDGFTRFLLSR
ncbi:AAA family ATPase [Bacteroides caecigallinarum]|nr:AAA family ATPase [Bacteroides caecigallinarum]